MDEKTKEVITANALERGEVRLALELWQYLPAIDSIGASLADNELMRHKMLMALLEEIAMQAWQRGVQRGHQEEINESQDRIDTGGMSPGPGDDRP